MENNQALLLFDQLAQDAKHLAEFEFHIATQNALSDRLETLVKQQADFQTFTKSFETVVKNFEFSLIAIDSIFSLC